MKNTREKIIASAVLLALATGCVQNYKLSKENNESAKTTNISSVLTEKEEIKTNFVINEFNKGIELKNKADELKRQKEELEEQKRKQKQEKIDKVKKECEESINLYSSVYNIKSEVVKKIVSDYTNNFSNKDFINNKTINDGEKHDSFDYEIIMLVSHLNDYPEEFGYDYSSIRKKDINGNLDNFTIREFVNRTSTALNVDPMLSLSIACAESGYFEAGIATNNCNPFSLRSSGDFYTFDNIYEGITEGIINLKVGYIDEGATTLDSIAVSYCGGSSSWINLVEDVRYDLENGRTIYDEDNMKLTLK